MTDMSWWIWTETGKIGSVSVPEDEQKTDD